MTKLKSLATIADFHLNPKIERIIYCSNALK